MSQLIIDYRDNLVCCNTCGRNFAQDRIGFHEQICAKTTNKKRKQFDAMTFRVKGTELEPFVKKGVTGKKREVGISFSTHRSILFPTLSPSSQVKFCRVSARFDFSEIDLFCSNLRIPV